jgi:GT2 family glycosyltransferase
VRSGSVDNPVTVSVIVPVFNPPVPFLRQCLASVLTQSARNWQLIVSDDGSTDEQVRAYLDEFTKVNSGDPRIVVLRAENGGISAAQNRALEHVTAPFFGWLDHDDALDPRCIERFSVELEEFPDSLIVYSDEDKIDARGRHYELYCKPDFSPELLLTQMYVCHFTVFRTDAVRAVGGFRSAMDGAQDFDLALRLLPQVWRETSRVRHIPLPLYHWRAWSESTALTIDAKPWAQESAARAQQEFLDVSLHGGSVQPSRIRGLNDVRPRVPEPPLVSVIIPTVGTARKGQTRRLVDEAVASLRAHTGIPIEIIAVTTGAIDPIEGVDTQVVYETDAFNFAEAINIGRAHAQGSFLFLLNDDTSVAEGDPVLSMLEVAQIPGVGVVGAKLTYPNGKLQHAGIVLLATGPHHVHISRDGSDPGYFGSTLTPRNYSAVTAAALLVRTEVFDALGGFDTTFARDYNDIDFCLRVRETGLRVAWTPYAHLVHHEGSSIVRKAPQATETALFVERWGALFVADPYYSTALNPSLDRLYEPR